MLKDISLFFIKGQGQLVSYLLAWGWSGSLGTWYSQVSPFSLLTDTTHKASWRFMLSGAKVRGMSRVDFGATGMLVVCFRSRQNAESGLILLRSNLPLWDCFKNSVLSVDKIKEKSLSRTQSLQTHKWMNYTVKWVIHSTSISNLVNMQFTDKQDRLTTTIRMQSL